MRCHFYRPGSAVQSKCLDGGERLDHVECGTDLGAEQHRAGLLHRDLHEEGNLSSSLRHRAVSANDGGLDHEQVLERFQKKSIRAALKESTEGVAISGFQLIPGGLA